jgi:hypothetical protein
MGVKLIENVTYSESIVLMFPNALKRVQKLHKLIIMQKYHNSRFCDRNRLLEKEKKGGGGAKTEVEKESSELIKSENLVIFCII